MAQYDFQVADYERIFRKRYKLVVLTVILAVGFSIMFARMKPPVYSASATVKVDRNTMMGTGTEAVMYGAWDNIETQTKVITSSPVLLQTAKRLSMLPDTISDEVDLADEKTMSVLAGIRGRVTTRISSGTNIISISVTSNSPEQARDMANSLAICYKEFSTRGKKLHVMKTRSFIEEQLRRCRMDLADAEADIERFTEEQRVPSIDANAARVINEAASAEKGLEVLENTVKVIKLQQAKLRDRLEEKSMVIDSLSDEPVSDEAAELEMGWVSEFTSRDPGLPRLNNRLIELQMQLNDQLAYYKPDHPTTRNLKNRIRETIQQMLHQYDKRLVTLAKDKEELEKRQQEAELEMQLLPANEMQYARLRRKLKVKEELHAMFTRKLEESLIAEAGVVDDVTIMSLAVLPRVPINKNMSRMAGMGVFLGLIFGIIFAIVREMFDTSIGTIEDVERALKMVVLAVIPHIQNEELKKKKKGGGNGKDGSPYGHLRSFLVTHFNPKDPTAESYRILRTNIDYLSFERPFKTLLLTSSTMQEGKSTTISNLAVAFAQEGKKVLLLECNLRRPSLHRIFGTDPKPGTSDILIGRAKWQDCVKSVTDLALGDFSMEEILSIPGLDNFHLINYGHRPPNPAELLSSSKMEELLRDVRDYFDIVLVDAPPILPVADAIVLSSRVDGVMLVYMVGKAPRNSLRLAKERLEAVNANIFGLVLNDIRPETAGLTYSSYYMYSYTPGAKDGRKRKVKRPR